MKSPFQNDNKSHPLLIGLRGARANFVPGLIVQAAVVSVVLAYYFYEPARAWMGQLALLKQRWSFGFSFISGAVAGGLLPEVLVVVVFQRGRVRRANFENLIFGMLLWGWQSMMVDAFYQFQAWMFGPQVDVQTVIKKMLVDQFLYTLFYATTSSLAAFDWKNQGYSFAGLGEVLTWRYFKQRTIPAAIAAWGVWIPAVCMIYSLPPLLQIPLFSLTLTFWVILFTWITRQRPVKTTT